MRAQSAPLLQVSKGRNQPGSPRRFTLRSLRRLGWMVVAGLAVLATTALLLSGSSSSSDDGSVAGSEEPPWTVSGLEAAVQLQHNISGGGSETGPDSLAAAKQRVDKAVALPPAAFRSHSAGIFLSADAVKSAAACTGPRCDLILRFVLAAEEARALADTGGCAVQHCPDALGIGLRPLPYTAFAFGNRCEPLYNRGALEVVRQLLDTGEWRGLEWFTGSSTSWLLARLAHLTSVEAAKGFADKARSVAEAQFEGAWLKERWELQLIPPQGAVATFGDTESPAVFEEYCALRFLPHGAQYDFISVQGFARMACLERAVALLRPQGGLLVLPQAQRPAYKAAKRIVPRHWLQLTDAHAMGETHVWMSINK